MDGQTDGRTDGRTHPLIEMRERIWKGKENGRDGIKKRPKEWVRDLCRRDFENMQSGVSVVDCFSRYWFHVNPRAFVSVSIRVLWEYRRADLFLLLWKPWAQEIPFMPLHETWNWFIQKAYLAFCAPSRKTWIYFLFSQWLSIIAAVMSHDLWVRSVIQNAEKITYKHRGLPTLANEIT